MTRRWIERIVEGDISREFLMEECCDRGHVPVRLQQILRVSKQEQAEWAASEEGRHKQFSRRLLSACISGPLSMLAVIVTGSVLAEYKMHGFTEGTWVVLTVVASFAVGILLGSFFGWRFVQYQKKWSSYTKNKETTFLQQFGLALRPDRISDISTKPGGHSAFLLFHHHQTL